MWSAVLGGLCPGLKLSLTIDCLLEPLSGVVMVKAAGGERFGVSGPSPYLRGFDSLLSILLFSSAEQACELAKRASCELVLEAHFAVTRCLHL